MFNEQICIYMHCIPNYCYTDNSVLLIYLWIYSFIFICLFIDRLVFVLSWQIDLFYTQCPVHWGQLNAMCPFIFNALILNVRKCLCRTLLCLCELQIHSMKRDHFTGLILFTHLLLILVNGASETKRMNTYPNDFGQEYLYIFSQYYFSFFSALKNSTDNKMLCT